jgi:hypothetical protein
MGTSDDFLEAARAAVAAAIERAKSDGRPLNVGEVVSTILTRFPTTGLVHEDLESDAARLALAQGVEIIEFHPKDEALKDQP